MIKRSGLRAVFPAIGALAAALALVLYATEALERADLSTQDTRFSIRGTEEPPDDLILVVVDDITFSDLGEQWPFPRSMHARVIDHLHADGAAQIAYDVQFTEPTVPREDNALILAVEEAAPIVLATTEVDELGRTNVLGGDALLREVGARAGNATYDYSPGSVVRRIGHGFDGLETFAVAAVEARTGERVDASKFPNGGAWIDYLGPPGTIPGVSFSRVLRGDFEPGTFAGRTVVVGAAAPSLQDLHSVPTSSDQMAGPEIQANAIHTVAEGLPLSAAAVPLDVLLILALALTPALLYMRVSPLRALGGAALIALGYLATAQLSFNAGLILPVVYPLVGLAVSGVAGIGAAYLVEAFRRQRVRDAFARFVPEPIVGELERSDEGLRLGGREHDVTVMFSDIRGFTTFSESRPPDEVLDILNRYLSEMTEAILDHGGTLASFLGDGIMAVFGAPIRQEDHAARALAATREMLGPRLKRFNDWVVSEGLAEPFLMGVGLHSGPVMAGQVGSEQRLQYTIIGDTVNTAARLEGMTKGTRHALFVADSTREQLGEEGSELEFVDELAVRGREGTIKVWAVPGL